jgi:TolB-like protein/class 3 adenylate cyclase/Flp pilus assembly protein TadD
MADEGFKRKLTAILVADVKGYSRLMGEDEEATIRTLTEYRKIISDQVKQHEGRVVDSPGDNILAEFASVVDALKCAVDTQKEIAKQNESLPENRKMEFRIGVNLGDVAEEGDRIYGDGVNVAARIESLSDPGGICISRSAYDQVRKRLSLGYEYLGEHSVKNIDEPVRVYRVLTAPEYAGRVIGEKTAAGKKWRRLAYTAVACLIVVAGGLIAWNIYLQKSRRIEPADIEKMAFPLPDKPSIAVLPFDNMTGDDEKEYIANGITEQITTVLSKSPRLFVVSRSSTFTYKDKPAKVQEVSQELGVRYVLEGSIQKAGDKLRITAQLIDAVKGYHLWAENYDRAMENLFDVQDEIAQKIFKSMHVELAAGEWDQVASSPSKNLEAYLNCLKGVDYYQKFKFPEAKQLFQAAIDIDPTYVAPVNWLAACYFMQSWTGPSSGRKEALKQAYIYAKKALSMNPSSAYPHMFLGVIYLAQRKYDEALKESELAISFDPNNAIIARNHSLILRSIGRYEDAIEMAKKAKRLDPQSKDPRYSHELAGAYFFNRDLDHAVAEYEKALKLNPDFMSSYIGLTATYSLLGMDEKAHAAAEQLLRLNPNLSLKNLRRSMPYKDPADINLLIDGLQKAGLN